MEAIDNFTNDVENIILTTEGVPVITNNELAETINKVIVERLSKNIKLLINIKYLIYYIWKKIHITDASIVVLCYIV